MNKPVDVRRVAALLSDRTRSEDPRTFPEDPITAEKAGLYSWWADEEAEAGHVRFMQQGLRSAARPPILNDLHGVTRPSDTATSKN